VPASTLEAYIIIGIVIMAAALLMAVALSKAAKQPAPSALITALSMLTLFSVAGGIATNNDEAWTIAAAGVGALAGSVTSLFQDKQQKQEVIQEVMQQVKEEQEDEFG
jgi:hypothetical protein